MWWTRGWALEGALLALLSRRGLAVMVGLDLRGNIAVSDAGTFKGPTTSATTPRAPTDPTIDGLVCRP